MSSLAVSQRCQYALRTIFELFRRKKDGPLCVSEIAEAQAIPPRFLELILAQLKQAGFVESRRGFQGGYIVVGAPDKVTVGEIIRTVEGPLSAVKCIGGEGARCSLKGACAFKGLWDRLENAVAQVYDSTTFQTLLDDYQAGQEERAPNYTI